MQNFVKNFLIVYETKSRRVEYHSRKFPRLFLRWKAGTQVGFAEFNNTADNRANIGGTIIGAPIVGQ